MSPQRWESIQQALKEEGWDLDSVRVMGSGGSDEQWRVQACKGTQRLIVESHDLASAYGTLHQRTRVPARPPQALRPRFGRMDKVKATHPREKVRLKGYVMNAEFDGQRWMYEVALPDSTESFNHWLPDEDLEPCG